MSQEDTISIHGLDLPTQIGVPEAERAGWQNLLGYFTLWPKVSFSAMADDLSATVNYDAVAQTARKLASSRPRQLLETLASDLAGHLLDHFALGAVEIELRKRILPGVDYVAVRLKRCR